MFAIFKISFSLFSYMWNKTLFFAKNFFVKLFYMYLTCNRVLKHSCTNQTAHTVIAAIIRHLRCRLLAGDISRSTFNILNTVQGHGKGDIFWN